MQTGAMETRVPPSQELALVSFLGSGLFREGTPEHVPGLLFKWCSLTVVKNNLLVNGGRVQYKTVAAGSQSDPAHAKRAKKETRSQRKVLA